MTDIEEQVRLYAEAVGVDRPAPRRSSATAGPTRGSDGRRGAFLVAAAALVIVVLVAAVVALRSSGEDEPGRVSSIQSSGSVELRLDLSTDTPSPDEEVTAEVTLTNIGDDELTVPCVTVQVESGAGPERLEGRLGTTGAFIASSFFGQFVPADELVDEPITLDQLEAAARGDAGALRSGSGCVLADGSLAPGASTTAEVVWIAGESGLAPGPATVSATTNGPLSVSAEIPVTLPVEPDRPVSRRRALEIALADPEVQAAIDALPPQPSPLPGLDASSVEWLRRVPGGWQVGYAEAGGAFLVTLDDDGTVTSVDHAP